MHLQFTHISSGRNASSKAGRQDNSMISCGMEGNDLRKRNANWIDA